jgi:hypothetical protein
MKSKAYLLILVLVLTVESYSAWTDIIINTDAQLGQDAQFIVVTVNGTAPHTPKLAIYGGSIGTLIVNGTAEITMSGGTISSDFYVFDPENLDDDGIIRCPYENDLSLNDTSTMIMSGGVIEGHISIAAGARMDLYGDTFQSLPDGRSNVHLLGYWQNDQPVNLYFVTNSFDRVILHEIPEPATLILFGFGGLLLRRGSSGRN